MNRNLDQRCNEIIMFVLEQLDQENIHRDLEVCAELILISRLIYQRFKLKFDNKIKKNSYIEKAKAEIINEMKNDESFSSIIYLIKNYREFKEKNIN